jgi:hypothetical protein
MTDSKGLTVGELRAFLTKHNVPDDAELLLEHIDPVVDEPVSDSIATVEAAHISNGVATVTFRVEG